MVQRPFWLLQYCSHPHSHSHSIPPHLISSHIPFPFPFLHHPHSIPSPLVHSFNCCSHSPVGWSAFLPIHIPSHFHSVLILLVTTQASLLFSLLLARAWSRDSLWWSNSWYAHSCIHSLCLHHLLIVMWHLVMWLVSVDSCDDVDPSSSTTSPVTSSIVLLTHRLRTRYCHVLTWVLVLVALSWTDTFTVHVDDTSPFSVDVSLLHSI